jgi:hypothetical protein
MRLFCDQCGTEFGAKTLRADSKFCSICGKALSDYIRQQSVHLFKLSPKSGRTSLSTDDNKSLSKKRKNIEEEEEESASDNQRRTRFSPRKQTGQTNGVVDNNTEETSTEENPESEETEAQVCPF